MGEGKDQEKNTKKDCQVTFPEGPYSTCSNAPSCPLYQMQTYPCDVAVFQANNW